MQMRHQSCMLQFLHGCRLSMVPIDSAYTRFSCHPDDGLEHGALDVIRVSECASSEWAVDEDRLLFEVRICAQFVVRLADTTVASCATDAESLNGADPALPCLNLINAVIPFMMSQVMLAALRRQIRNFREVCQLVQQLPMQMLRLLETVLGVLAAAALLVIVVWQLSAFALLMVLLCAAMIFWTSDH